MSLLFLSKPVRVVRSGLALLSVACLPASSALAGAAPAAKSRADDFMPYVEMAPFVVKGKQLTISIHARSKRDRRYAEEFSGEVVKVVCESVTAETGKGLVIIGRKGEPHPIHVFRRFLALAKAGKLDPGVAARAPELDAALDRWQHGVGDGKSVEGDGREVDLEFEKIVAALPLPLEGIGAQLYQLAWHEGFDDTRVEAALRALRPADLEGSLFARFDWVFYLPARGAFEQALDNLIADALEEDNEGLLVRIAVKGVMLVVRPKIRQAIEAMRRGVMFSAVVGACTEFSREETSALADAYMEANMPDFDREGAAVTPPGTPHERSVRAVRAALGNLGKHAAAGVQPEAGSPSSPP